MAISTQQTQLWTAAQNGDMAQLRMAILNGADLELRDDQERTAMNIASQYGQTEVMKTLLAAKEMNRFEAAGIPLFPEDEAAAASKNSTDTKKTA